MTGKEEMLDTETWRAIKRKSQHLREQNRVNAQEILARYPAIQVSSNNNGVHLIVKHGDRVVDFWPSTGKWIDRAQRGVHMRGIFRLLKHLGIAP